MKVIFRNYQNCNASIFELIGGDSEVKQTTALGYLLSQDENVLRAFFNLKQITSILGKIKIETLSKIVVHTELTSTNDKRVDIAILLYKDNKPLKALLIEAKSIKLSISPKDVVNQLEGYLLREKFQELKHFKDIFGCILSKNDFVLQTKNITSISWNNVIAILNKYDGLPKEFLNFLMKINGTMNFYEEEVYSIPAGETSELVYQYPSIYECPNSGTNYTSIKKPLYLAFRKKGGGVMEKLFGLENIIVLNPSQDFDSFQEDPSYSEEIKKRVKYYCDDSWGENYANEEKQFFILSLSNQIDLPHKPKPNKNNSFRAYYKLADLLNCNKKII